MDYNPNPRDSKFWEGRFLLKGENHDECVRLVNGFLDMLREVLKKINVSGGVFGTMEEKKETQNTLLKSLAQS